MLMKILNSQSKSK